VTLDLGPEMDPKYLQTEGTYQLILSHPSNEVESKRARWERLIDREWTQRYPTSKSGIRYYKVKLLL